MHHPDELRRFKANFFKALAHPLRIAVVDSLRGGEMSVNELSALLKVEQSALSQQLAVLRTRNVVTGRKEGLNVYYSVPDPMVFNCWTKRKSSSATSSTVSATCWRR